MNPELPSVLLMAPTGVAAINIHGTTINTALGIPKTIDRPKQNTNEALFISIKANHNR